METMFSDFMKELECPVCMNHMLPPILQCDRGHSVCSKCRGRLTLCPICMGNISQTRNYTLENLSAKIPFPCSYKSNGCCINLPLSERENHEKVCPFGPKIVSCAMDNCPWTGRVDDLKSHWESKKQACKPYDISTLCKIKVKDRSNFVNLVNAHNNLFWFRCIKNEDAIQWGVQFIGKKEEDRVFFYEIEIFVKSAPKRRIVLSEYCSYTGQDIFAPENSINMPINGLVRFINEEELWYRITVKFEKKGQKPNNETSSANVQNKNKAPHLGAKPKQRSKPQKKGNDNPKNLMNPIEPINKNKAQ